MFAKTIALLLCFVATPFVSYYIATQAWGLEVKSWYALIGGYCAFAFLTLVIEACKGD